ncbi:MAG: MFS transporter [Myxococcota bacterium]|jgi:predicted MFS family arabinose efflux permease|nr:MFS transporter [Myxococcota bacterium]
MAAPAPPESSAEDDPTSSPNYRWYALALLTTVYVINFVDRQILSILLQPIKVAFDVSDTAMGFLVGFSFAIFYATLGIPIAMWADRSNRRNIIAVALAIFSTMTALCGVVTSFFQLAIARIGVGVGEAGTSPPSHSIIADLFSPHERATALGIFAVGVNLGIMIGFFAGGWLEEVYGWRVAFLAVGLPGLVLALIVQIFLREPLRGLSEGRSAESAAEAPPLEDAVRLFAANRTLRNIAIGGGLNSFVGYGSVNWFPTFLIRSYDMNSSDIGMILALIIGLGGGLGTFGAGFLADRFAQHDIRWNLWLPPVLFLSAFPLNIAVFLSTDASTSLWYYVIPAVVGTVYLAPALAMVQTLVPLRMRTVASALLLFVINMIGMGLGPQAVGVLSDLLVDRYGDESVRYALMIASFMLIWSGAHFVMAARTLREDLARARAAAAAHAG